jgi:integrase
MTLFWTGMRIGELLALTPTDINFEDKTISISKSYQRIDKRDVITPPKTPKSNRIITIPDFLLADLKDYMNSIYCLQSTDRLFPITKYYMEYEIQRRIKNSGVKRIRIHDIRHSHCAMLLEMRYTFRSSGTIRTRES